MNRIHIFGASGSGTTTLGKALANRLTIAFFDSDDYYWQKTDPPYRESYPKEERAQKLLKDIKGLDNWVLSGSLVSWGDIFIPMFTLAVFVTLPHDIRLERLRIREYERYGERIQPGGDMHQSSQAFLEWASRYDTAGLEMRSLKSHQTWMQNLSCPVLYLKSLEPTTSMVDKVINFLTQPIASQPPNP